jgi:hypothetical protein
VLCTGVKVNKPAVFVALAFIIGATISQGAFAFADDSTANPFRAIWEAIGELQTKTDSLQAQIDELKTQQQSSLEVPASQVAAKSSEISVSLQVSSGQSGQSLVSLIAKNAGPDSAVGVKISTYYQMSLFRVNSIDGAQCTDQARGIIECYLGTIESGSDARIMIDATPLQLDQQAVITSDVSSITKDRDPSNNHAESVFGISTAPQAAGETTATTPVSPVQQQQEQHVPAPVSQPSTQNSSATQPENPPTVSNPQADQNQTSGQDKQAESGQSKEQSSNQTSTSSNNSTGTTNDSQGGTSPATEASSPQSTSSSGSDTNTTASSSYDNSTSSPSQSPNSSSSNSGTESNSNGPSSSSIESGSSSNTGSQSSSSESTTGSSSSTNSSESTSSNETAPTSVSEQQAMAPVSSETKG